MHYENPRCEYCSDQGLVSVVHKDSIHGEPVIQEYADPRTGEVRHYRWPASIAVHCDCPKGIWMRDNTAEDVRARIPTLQEVFAQRRNGRLFPYVLESTVPEYFKTKAEGIRVLANMKSLANTFPDVPRSKKSDPIEIANQLRERSAREEAAKMEPAS